MVQVTCTRRLEIDAGHRVLGHGGKCVNLHGHRFAFEITAHAEQLDRLGMVIDFGEIKKRVGGWLDVHWDHAFLVYARDEEARKAMACVSGQKYVLLPCNPTSENLAHHLLQVANEVLSGTGITVVKVVCYETPNCWAEAVADG